MTLAQVTVTIAFVALGELSTISFVPKFQNVSVDVGLANTTT